MEDRRFVTQDQFTGRQQLIDERCSRDKERLETQENAMQEVRDLTIQMGEILKKLSDTSVAHEKRLCELERQPADQYSKIKMLVAGAVIGGVISFVINAAFTAAK